MFLGSRADMGDVLAAADVVLFASRSDGMEGMPAVVIEGGMSGLPVAAFAVAGVARWSSMGKPGCSRLQETPTVFRSTWSVSFWTPICEHDSVRLRRHAVEPCSPIDAIAPQYLDIFAEVAGQAGEPQHAHHN